MKHHEHDKQWLNWAEQNRRETGGGFDCTPLPYDAETGEGYKDYAEALSTLTAALAHLNEGIPCGQAERVLGGLQAAKEAVAQLEAWLEAKGVYVPV